VRMLLITTAVIAHVRDVIAMVLWECCAMIHGLWCAGTKNGWMNAGLTWADTITCYNSTNGNNDDN
jgi:hypothetical protein